MAMWIRLTLAVLACLTIQARAASSLQDGLLLYYSFDQDEAGQVTDQSGQGRHARVQGPRWISEGARGGAYHFEQQGQTIEADDEGLPMGDEPRALSWWFKLDSLRPPNISTDIINYGTLAPAQFFATCVDWRVGRDCLASSPYGWAILSNRKLERAGVWHHAVLTYAGNGQYQYYMDGQPCPTSNESSQPLQTQPGGRFFVGTYTPDIHGLDGCIDEVRVYGRVLEPAEVTELYQQGSEAARAHPANPVQDIAKSKAQPRPVMVTIESTPPALPDRTKGTTSLPQAAATEHQITRIGFSTQEDGDRDVTLFYTDETLHVWVQDAGLNPTDTNILVKASIYQQNEYEGHADLSVNLEARADGSFKAELQLHTLRPGRALVDVAGYDMRGRVLRLFKTTPIILRDPSELMAQP